MKNCFLKILVFTGKSHSRIQGRNCKEYSEQIYRSISLMQMLYFCCIFNFIIHFLNVYYKHIHRYICICTAFLSFILNIGTNTQLLMSLHTNLLLLSYATIIKISVSQGFTAFTTTKMFLLVISVCSTSLPLHDLGTKQPLCGTLSLLWQREKRESRTQDVSSQSFWPEMAHNFRLHSCGQCV